MKLTVDAYQRAILRATAKQLRDHVDETDNTDTGGRYCACMSAAPSAVPALLASKTGTDVSFDWSAVEVATGYDVVKGPLSDLLHRRRLLGRHK